MTSRPPFSIRIPMSALSYRRIARCCGFGAQ